MQFKKRPENSPKQSADLSELGLAGPNSDKSRYREGEFSGQPYEERGKTRGGKTGVFPHGQKKTLIIDNYDSFTYNLYQYIAEIGGNPIVSKNDELSLRDIEKIAPSHIILSAGPGTVENKKDFGICAEVIKKFSPKIPILGVCLGHQGIIHTFGGKIIPAPEIIHGKQSPIEHDHSTLFRSIQNPFLAMRYHSLCGSPENLPKELKITAWTKEKKIIMAIQHLTYPLFGVQFHPESFGTESGKQLLENFLKI